MTIRYLHYRPYLSVNYTPVVAGKGGTTVAYVEDEGENTITFGVAYCNDVDNFCRRLGRIISKGRLNTKPETFTGNYKEFIAFCDEQSNANEQYRSIQVFPKA